MRLQHCCYVQSVGKIPNYRNKPSSTDFQLEDVEKYLESAILYQNVTELLQKREEFAVVEDDFGPTLTQMLIRGKKPSFSNLNVNEDDAKTYAFAIAFYTGAYSEMLNLSANIFARRWQRNKATDAENVQGRVVRYVKLNEKDLKDYQPGEILTWLRFSSSDKGDDNNAKHLRYFKEHNTKFIIHSLTGRNIRDFSNCAKDEDEVLFLPHSTFLIELGLCKYVILWVDDRIFHEWWENKGRMEKASTLGTQVNVHFMPKSTTEDTLAFLRSEFGKRLKSSETFRIVTDMNRDNESSPNDAGIRLLCQVRKLGFHQICLIFTSNALEGRRKLKKVFQ
ncbi:unnamed protein product [Rotaria sordida]|uniref:NAD(+)--protein-arginine ADP-ribosyltransferase n=1 Tax=Rotaria sordida TaxID=392033 RepID=A0A814UX32_9BILA|nr:unnamed protein product [Rotaria sordida]CAF1180931.1 unnamed protein product [Rotaria sordida]CAF1190082.1 unnamed protein product [Rotaria sordida]